MLDFSLYEFFGIAPRLRGKQLPQSYATVAHDVDLTHGILQPFREPLKVSDKTGASRVASYGCDIFTFDQCVSVAEWLPDCPRLYITGRVGYPEVATIEAGALSYRRLGVPRPAAPPRAVAEAVSTSSDKARSVAYVVTFVNGFGEESAPSLPSMDVVIDDGQTVVVSFEYDPAIEYDVKQLRVYRRDTGFRVGAEKEQTLATHWYLVAEESIDSIGIVDKKLIKDVGYGLTSLEVREPPTNLGNITSISGTAMLVGSSGNKLVFSENLQPYSFPIAQEMTLDDNIVALGSQGNTIFVATDGHPYRLVADAGCDKRDCRQIVKYDQPMPMINCHIGQGSVITPFGMVYVSADGLVLLSDSDSPAVITSDVLSADDWRKLKPHTMRLAYHKGALFVVSEAISFMYWVDAGTYKDTKHKRMVTISDEPIDMVETRQGELLMMTADGVYQWNASGTLRPYLWVSENIDANFLFAVTRVRLDVLSASVKCTLESARGEVSRQYATGDTIIPFSRLGRHKDYHIRVEGIGEVSELEIGVSQLDMGGR